MTTDQDVQKALDVARALIKAGVPVFAAESCTEGCPRSTVINSKTGERKPHEGGPGKYHLPKHWEQTIPAESWLSADAGNPNGWRPGYALAAVGGHVADFLDGDPRNGGEESLRELHERGIFPVSFGQQKTPSGGTHEVIAPTGLRKATGATGGFLPGLDLQSGAADGQGRGFVWIAPTVRRSKVDGELRAYEWTTEPDFEALNEAASSGDAGIEGIVSLITENRAKRTEPKERAAPAADPNDPFLSSSQLGAVGGVFSERAFTTAEAQEYVRPSLVELSQAPIGEIEERANIAAATLSHFVPAFWSVDAGMELLENMLAHTAYDPNGPSDWTADKFRAVLDGSRPVADPWLASHRPEPPAAPAVVVEAAPGEESLSTYEKLKRKLISAKALSQRPAPKFLIQGLLNLNTEAWLIGAPGSLKSFIALDMAGQVARGQEWQGRRTKKRDVLYLAAEGEGGMTLRTAAWIADRRDDMEGVTFLPYPVQVKSNDGQWEALVRIAAELQPGLIVIDTQARITVGLEENSADQMGILINAVGQLKRATGACVLVVHHTGRDGKNARGSSALDGAQDSELKVVRPDNPKGRASLLVTLQQDKQKDMSEGDGSGIPMAMKVVDLGTDPETGDSLSSLVVDLAHDAVDVAMRAAEGITELEQEAKVVAGTETEGWTKSVPGIPSNAKVQRYILQVLADHAHSAGLTQSEAKRAVLARWYPKNKPDDATWVNGWKKVISLDMACNTGGERWALDQAELSRMREADPFD